MPLSRLSPRSSRKGLARQRSSSSSQASSQRHLQLWAAIRKTREELDLWQRQVDQVEALFNQHIVPREYALTEVMSTVTERLIQHFSKTDLDIPNQSLLGLWINENLDSLQDHPFGDEQFTRVLTRQWLELLNNDGPVENQLARLVRRNNAIPASDGNASGNSAQHTESSRNSADYDTDANTSEHRSTTDRTASDEQAHVSDEKQNSNKGSSADEEHVNGEEGNSSTAENLRSLKDKLSVERLFRQLAKVLHPDREQDETLRAEKHELMSQCLKARQEKDINALLSLYCEHVGELPDDLNNDSHSELISALEAQLKELQTHLRYKRFGDPLQSMIVQRYSSSDTSDAERRIQTHAHSLDAETSNARELVEQLKEHDGLLDALDERRSVEQDRMAINEMTGL